MLSFVKLEKLHSQKLYSVAVSLLNGSSGKYVMMAAALKSFIIPLEVKRPLAPKLILEILAGGPLQPNFKLVALQADFDFGLCSLGTQPV